jgi:leucyl-tRNA synthetase
MSVPAHDERDYEFAAKYGLPIVQVIRPEDETLAVVLPFVSEDGVLMNSGEYDGLSCTQAEKKLQEVAVRGGFGEPKVTFRLKDWGVSRQRYWGTPIPDDLIARLTGWCRCRKTSCRCCCRSRLRLRSRAVRRWARCRSL